MKDTLKIIFNMAVKELPERYHRFQGEDAVMYRGFKISRTQEGHKWEDTRFDDYYEVVDPKITENILKGGFAKTLTEVMLHNDYTKIDKLNREVEELSASITFWVTESTRIYTDYNKKRTSVNKDNKISDEVKTKRKDSLKKRYDKQRDLFQKKRRVISEERDELLADKRFYESRLQLYNRKLN